ncbi:uncharacterized protein LOC108666757 [Hyalella azteca]|uniref:Uncharacterized protein LOC108666757 n=1 Tax=Hyalella azteca TaxID=294128 RepID=A0A8B7N5L5_HYAAZ|nr:uncharacterized protein LOC108666757 [Hyalella azteca]
MTTMSLRLTFLLAVLACHDVLTAPAAESNRSSALAISEKGDVGDFGHGRVLWVPTDDSSQRYFQDRTTTGQEVALGEDMNASRRPHHVMETSKEEDPKIRSVKKRSIKSISTWGSNPYFLGKRYNRAFWTARGKKNARDVALSSPEIESNHPYYDTQDNPTYGSSGDFYSHPSKEFVDGEDIVGLEGWNDLSEAIRKMNMIPVTDKRRSGLFWAARGKRQNEDAPDEYDFEANNEKRYIKELNPKMHQAFAKFQSGDNPQFWMSRGRRFWAARGKKTVDPSTFNRLARLVNSGNADNYYDLEPTGESEHTPEPQWGYGDWSDSELSGPPIFWAVRGKKSSVAMFDDMNSPSDPSKQEAFQNSEMEKKSTNQFASALSHLRSRGFETPNFWANRGRKNFWAARGKRDLSLNDGKF